MKNLVIVESPAKSKTITKYLGKDFAVLASYGHVRDLPAKKGSVDPEHNFKMTYELIDKNTRHVNEIVSAVKKADALYLATDPDREGEAISWHLYEILKGKKLLKGKPVHRVVFHEITKSAITDAVAHPRDISMDLVNAQQARLALDYLVGFNLSPLLWKKVARGLSAGRVQSPALRLIVEREIEIENFKSQEYWSIIADLIHPKGDFKAKLAQYLGKPLKQFDINNEKDAKDALQVLTDAAQGKLKVLDIEKKQKQRQPAAPFITSTLQQEAVKKLGFTSKKAMMIAQNLYEGVEVGDETVGLITYMRTDSIVLSNDALTEARKFIEEKYGKDLVPANPRVFKSKSKNAQEAHEAIRPTSFYRTPDSVKKYLTPDQFKLYQLVWQRAIASQMEVALIDTVGIDLAAGDKGVFRATGSTIAKPGFLTVYQETFEDKKEDEDETGLLPALTIGEMVDIKEMIPKQHFTEPPPRYSEASLVKALEEYGIGRPSTYASIISTLQTRKYALLETKRFKPTDMGRVVNKFLTEYFTQYVDYDFTAKLEDELNDVADGKEEWIPLLEKFWQPFKAKVAEIDSNVKRSDVTQEAIDEQCPECSKPLTIRLSRNGRFIACTGYPECKYTRSVEQTAEEAKAEALEEEKLDRACPDCGHPLLYRKGRFGKFIGCSNYPKCKHIESLTNKNQPAGTGIECPECQKGEMVARKSRYGKIFYSCNRYPDCKYAIWNEPIKEACPRCAWPIMMLKTTKRRGTEKVCPKEGCSYAEVIAPPEPKA